MAIALPEVKWTGEPKPTEPGGSAFTVTLSTDGRIRYGDWSVAPREAPPTDELFELRAWWETVRGRDTTVWGGARTPTIELYADRSASWDRLRATLAFLAFPPHRIREVWIAVARTQHDPGTAYMRCLLGADPRRWAECEEDLFESAEEHRRQAALRELSTTLLDLPDMVYRGAYSRYASNAWRYRRMHSANDSACGDLMDVQGTRFCPLGPLDDPAVVSRANTLWAVLETWDCTNPRWRGPIHLRVWRDGDRWPDETHDSRPAIVNVPIAYPIACFDRSHARRNGVQAELIYEVLQLGVPLPDRFLSPGPEPALPVGVLIACVLVGVLCVMVVVAGRVPGSSPG